jgi:hypothetical protein
MEVMEHKELGIELFNATWDLIDKPNRTEAENFEMINKAHASCYHWSQGGGTALNNARGEWQLSHVYALLGMGESALVHGKYSLDICLKNNIKDFDLAFGYESMARAYKVLNNIEKMNEYKKLALDTCKNIEKDEDRNYAEGEIVGI